MERVSEIERIFRITRSDMLNCFQKILYYLSNACIAVILISIILNFKYGLSLTYICPGLISFIILILFIISFFIYKDKLADFEINVVDLTEIRECKIVCVNRYCTNLLYAPYWGKQR